MRALRLLFSSALVLALAVVGLVSLPERASAAEETSVASTKIKSRVTVFIGDSPRAEAIDARCAAGGWGRRP